MTSDDLIALKCQLSRTGFSHERGFRVPHADGGEYAGAAPVEYCFTRDGQPLEPNQPSVRQRLGGLIAARRLRDEDHGVLVHVPDGGVFFW